MNSKITKIIENTFKNICDDMVSHNYVKDISSEDLFNKYINHFTKTPEKSTSSTETKTKRKKTARQLWYSKPEIKAEIKQYCEQHCTLDGYNLKFMKGVSELWNKLDTETKQKYEEMASSA